MRLDGVEKQIINPFKKPQIETALAESIQIDNIQNINKQKQDLFQSKDTQRVTLSQKELNKMIDEIRHKFSLLERYLQIDIDQQLQIPISKIIDMRTEEVIRQIPPEWIIEILRRMEELRGVLYSKEV